MPKPIKTQRGAAKRKTKRKPTTSKGGPPARRPRTRVEPPSEAEEAAYVETLIDSGEAAPLTPEGKLPAGATHKVVEDGRGRVKVVRRRFSIG